MGYKNILNLWSNKIFTKFRIRNCYGFDKKLSLPIIKFKLVKYINRLYYIDAFLGIASLKNCLLFL